MNDTHDEHGPVSFSLRDNVVIRLVLYYALTFAFFWSIEAAFPSVIGYMTAERRREARSQTLGIAEQVTTPENRVGPEVLLAPERAVPVLLSMIGALALALPVAWIYTWTRPHSKTREAVAQALVVLPIAIALVVFLVKGSLALAFSLAGIVAAVRFRTSLSDTTDAVFLFVVIGIGLAAGVQLLSVAFLASLFFNVTQLAVWWSKFADNPSRLVGLHLHRASLEEWGRATGSNSVDASFERMFSVRTTDATHAEGIVDLVLDRHAKRWRLNRISDVDGGVQVLEFSVRLKKRATVAEVIRMIREAGGPAIVGVESPP